MPGEHIWKFNTIDSAPAGEEHSFYGADPMGNYQNYATARVKTKISLQTRNKSQLTTQRRK